jgi:3-methyladenine DNA glycosylase AlkC
MAVIACNDADKKPGETNDPLKSQADSLQNEVVEGHDIAMPKSMRIPALQKETRRLIDSIGKLPAKMQKEAAPYKAKLENLLNDLDNAHTSMDKWMNEFKLDSAANNLQQRVNYLIEEKLKVEKVKEAVLSSLSKADSLLKAKF